MNCKMLNAPFSGISVIYFKIVIHIQVCLWRLILQVFISRWEYTVTPLCVCLSVTFCHICSQQLLIANAWNFYTLFVQACHMVGTMSTSRRLCLFCILYIHIRVVVSQVRFWLTYILFLLFDWTVKEISANVGGK